MTLDSGAKVKVICGKVNLVQGSVRDIVTDPEYLDVTVPPSSAFTRVVKPGHNLFAYVLDGEACFDEQRDAFSREMYGAGGWDTSRRGLFDAEEFWPLKSEGETHGSPPRSTTANRPKRLSPESGPAPSRE